MLSGDALHPLQLQDDLLALGAVQRVAMLVYLDIVGIVNAPVRLRLATPPHVPGSISKYSSDGHWIRTT
jgi:hypothetical protein